MQPLKFSTILENTRKKYTDDELLNHCPETKKLVDFAYGDLDNVAASETSRHINQCATCGIAMLKIAADRREWELEMALSPDKAISQALGPDGQKTVRQIIASRSKTKIVASTKKAISSWVSQLWTPKWAGQTVTAVGLPEQKHYFDMGDGEYVNLSCSWEGAQTQKKPQIRLSWSANIYSPSKIWVHFIDPDTNDKLTEVLLGTDLEGTLSITKPEIDFDPSARKWGLKMLIEPE